MSSLNTSLMIAMQSLFAQQGALQVTANNIANANTPGYSRVLPLFEEAAPTHINNLTMGNGVLISGYQSVRDQVLELRIDQLTQQNSGAQAQLGALQQIQTYFNQTGTDIGSAMSAFFASLSQLQTSPSDLTLRHSVLSSAQNLASAFHTTSAGLTETQAGLNQQVISDVGQINQLTSQIADLNSQLSEFVVRGQDGGAIQDQMNVALNKLATLTNIQVTKTESGIAVTTGSGTALVAGGKSFALQAEPGSGGMVQVIDAGGNNVTSAIQDGDLGGILQTRDTILPRMLNQLDTLASQFGAAINSANQSGTDLNGNAGTAIFNLPAGTAGAASTISMAISDPALIAASSDGSAGSGGNLTKLLAVRNATLPMGSSPVDAYSALVFDVGNSAAQAQAELTGTGSALAQLQDQRASISGVSIDEESSNLIRYQQAYQAAAKVISTISQLGAVILNMGSGGGGYF